MATITRTETRKRGAIGKLFSILFWLYNALMVAWLVMGLGASGDLIQNATSEAERTGAAAGTAIGVGIIIIFWAAGALILGLLVLLTPGKTIITETTRD